MAKVYIVGASAGHHDDYRCWNVRAFSSKTDAEAFAQKAKDRASKLCEWRSKENLGTDDDPWFTPWMSTPKDKRPTNALDPMFGGEHTSYFVETMQLRGSSAPHRKARR